MSNRELYRWSLTIVIQLLKKKKYHLPIPT